MREYRKSGYSKKFLAEHEDDIIIHKAAKKAFDEMGVKKLPTIKSLQVEFAGLLTAKKEAYAELKKVRDELRDLTVHKANYFKYLSDADKRNAFDIAKYLSGGYEVKENEPARTFVVDGAEDAQRPDDEMP